MDDKSLKIAVVGACASGKSVLAAALRKEGYAIRHVAQEHSYVPSMWQRITRPDLLIYLDVDIAAIRARRANFNFGPADLAEQKRRLAHAREHCDLYVNTSPLTPEEVQGQVLAFLEQLAAE